MSKLQSSGRKPRHSRLAGENPLAAAQVRGDAVDPDAIVRVANATARALSELNSAQPPRKYWTSQAEKEEQAARTQARKQWERDQDQKCKEIKSERTPEEEEAEVYRNCGVTL